MATWVAHMRVAEHFMKLAPALNNVAFLVGNIGPDCGVPNEDWSVFTPDKKETHWYDDNNMVDAEALRRVYLQQRDERYPFYLGYYFHLLTDIEWSNWYNQKKTEPLYANALAEDSNSVWKFKQDWYGQDRLYLQRHPDSVFYTMFAPIQSFNNIYLDYFPPDAFTLRIRYISEFYLNAQEDANRAFPYLSRTEMDGFVARSIASIGRKAVDCL